MGDAFMETFNEAKMKAEEEMVEVVERRRREAEDSVVMEDDQIAMADSSSVPVMSPITYLAQPLTHLTHLTQPLTHLTHLTQPLTHLTQPLYVPTSTQSSTTLVWCGAPQASTLSRTWFPGSSLLRDLSHLRNWRGRTSPQLWSSEMRNTTSTNKYYQHDKSYLKIIFSIIINVVVVKKK